jgi:hypothetical protein
MCFHLPLFPSVPVSPLYVEYNVLGVGDLEALNGILTYETVGECMLSIILREKLRKSVSRTPSKVSDLVHDGRRIDLVHWHISAVAV